MHTAYGILVSRGPADQLVDHVRMAPEAILLQDGRISGFDPDRLSEILQCEALGVVVAVAGLGDKLWDK